MVAISERLKELNYIPFSVDDKQSFSYSVLAGAMLFCQQMQIGGLDESLSGWQQQVLFSDFAQPSIYSWVNLSRKGTYRSVIAKSDFKISAGMNAGSACCVKGVVEHVESQDDKQVVMLVRGIQETRTYRITYQKPERSCDYLAGDHLIVFGTLESKTDDLAVISAQPIGFEDA